MNNTINIPKKIHYCWFGGNPLPEIAIQCLASWKKFCPDYEIVQWDESNVDLFSCMFLKQAYNAKKWAFVSDYVRLKIIYENGGVYLDTDVELLSSLDPFLSNEGFMGFEHDKLYFVNTGLGFGAIPKNPLIRLLMNNYENTNFVKNDGTLDTTPCPQRDTEVLKKLGLIQNNEIQIISGITIYPSDYFCPISFTGKKNFSRNTISIHHYNASWHTELEKNNIKRSNKLKKTFGENLGSIINNFFLVKDTIKNHGLKYLAKKIINKLR
ncbi:glycosyltransferase family 32 protein [Providencia rettgeri]|uniref:glycosyltransferase family 32 protein n=1 Tax=Providencia rettgeri TaxID=587 RepID=UPI001B36A639|nr:glycosyltransferase [Providencia rettgeri]MBQ0439801.1 glycosyl transferase [Providencia rettgeri]MBX6969486.1 glycosyl transferase [Providencia rettgeri]MBX6976637.1 glycosyl transferase [Providencia rettgeri]MBX6995447.1 glycosyl transferase [Providencia rettgeri]MBX6999690.1 glycosyl transferase [Providencia rettgeri]